VDEHLRQDAADSGLEARAPRCTIASVVSDDFIGEF
jgi:hypothetical protein